MSTTDRKLFFLGVLLACGPMLLLFLVLLPMVSRQHTGTLLTARAPASVGLAAVAVLEVGAIILLIRAFPGIQHPVLLMIFITSFGCIALTLLLSTLIMATAYRSPRL